MSIFQIGITNLKNKSKKFAPSSFGKFQIKSLGTFGSLDKVFIWFPFYNDQMMLGKGGEDFEKGRGQVLRTPYFGSLEASKILMQYLHF